MHKYSDLLKTLLEKRGITDEQEANIFLNPNYERDMHDPFLMKDMERACVRLYEAVDNKEKIVIYADYDCDGIPGAVILTDLFKRLNVPVEVYPHTKDFGVGVYIPQRNSEGYGLNMDAIKQFKDSGVKLIITVDLGITAVDEVAQAEADGVDVIITDHHLPINNPKASLPKNFLRSSEKIPRPLENSSENSAFILPRAYAILNPKTDKYPEKMLCGAGVAFKLAYAFLKKYGEYFEIKDGMEKWMLDMAGLATLSDMVPLTGENRVISYFGMTVLRKSPRPGLQKLLSKLNINQKYLSEDDVGFMIAPRLNAASRMDDPMRAFELLATSDEVEAGTLANHLSKINDDRKTLVTSIMREVNKKFSARGGSASGGEKSDNLPDVIVIGNPAWKIGILGLVAGKISDTYKKTVFVWGKDENDCIKGSCRSDGSASVVELMSESSEYFIDFGGHEMAGGFTVHHDKIHFLEEALSEIFSKIKKEKSETSVEYDVQATLDMVNKKTWKEIEKLAPFGFGNPKPIFLFKNVQIEKFKKFGKNGSGEHLEIIFSDGGKGKAVAISFFSNTESFKAPIEEGKKADLLATFDLSRFRGREELRLRIVDII